jgi:hypothetical protein
MNNKIKELKKQCYINLVDRTDDMEYDMEKFAELIIKECVQKMSDINQEYANLHLTILKQHFGV